MRWYRSYGRSDLPWRITNDAYAVYVSEVMLQQTQVKTVLERFYFQFLKAFPTLRHLAQASEQEVLERWQGLGYYRRARFMHAAARACDGTLPADVEALMALPGIGKNTAHAVACFGFGAVVPVMEANVKRVICRVFALEHASETLLWEKAEVLLNHEAAFDHNQAMMDLGAMICTPKNPDCSACPVSASCEGKGSPESYPQKSAKKAVPVRRREIWVLQNERGQFYATARKTAFLGGLYHFIELEPPIAALEWKGKMLDESKAEELGEIRQVYSHFVLEARVRRVRVAGGGKDWHTRQAMEKLPFSGAERKIIALLDGTDEAGAKLLGKRA